MAWIEHDGVLYNLDYVQSMNVSYDDKYFTIMFKYNRESYKTLNFETEKERDEYFDKIKTILLRVTLDHMDWGYGK